ncbi:pentapeptide repeat-containing protein [Amycolatopsis magusensis]|uniref:pentapeptide repeat-containing protein n=1 Tax=Amycolatopsis magusensis TaxID=882444 RepID=UPI0024A7F80B|nr:pentapeptide repeat-containing protein [Amycolatopsis magusensis]MDI5980111.1 pentapeptide repeat-containing protein [Amycolatopsis magusensis]
MDKQAQGLQRSKAETSGRVLSNRTVAAYATGLLALAVGLAWFLLAEFATGSEIDKARIDVVRTVGSIVLGAGGGVALLLAARRQQTAEQDLAHRRRVQQHAERVAADTQDLQQQIARDNVADATERRITELFDKAVDKLGADNAAVRFGGLYALERLAGHAINQQHAIAHVLCAYLRMPYSDPGEPPADDVDESQKVLFQRRREEREVRLAVQRVLAEHLRPEEQDGRISAGFWPAVTIDLTGATLLDFDWTGCRTVKPATFSRATFVGDAVFTGASFGDLVRFDLARFTGRSWWDSATFDSLTLFTGTTFTRDALFHDATFTGRAMFNEVKIEHAAWFHGTTFGEQAMFVQSSLTEDTFFNEATFADFVAFPRQSAVDLDGARILVNNSRNPRTRARLPVGWALEPLTHVPEDLDGGPWFVVRHTSGTVQIA